MRFLLVIPVSVAAMAGSIMAMQAPAQGERLLPPGTYVVRYVDRLLG